MAAEVAVRERWFGTLLAHSSDLIAVLDEQGRVLYVNPAAQRVLGYVPEDQLGRNMFELIHPDDLAATAENSPRQLDSPAPRLLPSFASGPPRASGGSSSPRRPIACTIPMSAAWSSTLAT